MPPRTLNRTRQELADFLRMKREKLSPQAVGLPSGTRRRTPGLRREEVAALAGVGLTWYTWLEQGREINASVGFLEDLARVLKLDATERYHLFLLAHQRPPVIAGHQWCQVTPLVRRLLDDLTLRPAYVMNLSWDIIAWNPAADRLFAIAERQPQQRNMLWMLFADPELNQRLMGWQEQAPQILASFRRDYARAPQDATMLQRIQALSEVSPQFRQLWQQHDIHGRCQGQRTFLVAGAGEVTFEHASFIVDEDNHLRLVMYSAQPDCPASAAFEAML
ncbi:MULTISPECIES: helix-turn-helix transcriptional regulator [Serratia]|uniref:Helix-turn-helix domain-containing protein n=1 Tax=Serratia fonticola TaxID=47917 RepID=A0AAW3WQD0_SERFO|nr:MULTISPECIES: helix-turn-helix transcriptional regulator [Serratia]ERK09715.1 putative DNA-binding protein [Serratia fonticola AU-P3(3)]ALX94240.1 XRE family transcriptional regulator [Serratia fonticola]MBC3213163.1 helix-turn-helix domain-containing protein [Serratia fonticola]MBC3253092.1 helix-turn-helix domain-containing protein [Serratia fonticola]MBP1019596.1 helix-turn-helix domain-containing protein [Serratia fonticola]